MARSGIVDGIVVAIGAVRLVVIAGVVVNELQITFIQSAIC